MSAVLRMTPPRGSLVRTPRNNHQVGIQQGPLRRLGLRPMAHACVNPCSASGIAEMYSAAPCSVTNGFRPGNLIGSKNRWSSGTKVATPREPCPGSTDRDGSGWSH
jgi:hypothetical protein